MSSHEGGFATQDPSAVSAVRSESPTTDELSQRVLDRFGESTWHVDQVVPLDAVDRVIDTANNVLEKDGVNAELPTGEEVTVSRHCVATTTTESKTAYLRLMRYDHTNRFRGREKRHMYLIFDDDESPERIRVDNPNFIKLSVGSEEEGPAGIFVETGLLDIADANDPEVVEFVKHTIMKIFNQIEDVRGKSREERARIMAERTAMAKMLWENTKTNVKGAAAYADQKKEDVIRWWRIQSPREKDDIIAGTVLGGVVLSVVGGLVGYAVFGDHAGPVERFDRAEYIVEGGAEAEIGETVNPGHSFDLAQSEDLMPDEVPELRGENDSTYTGKEISEGQSPDEQADIENLREIILEPGTTSETVYVNLQDPADKIMVWTDSSEYAELIEVTLEENNVTVKWNGDQITEDQIPPRVVIKRLPAGE